MAGPTLVSVVGSPAPSASQVTTGVSAGTPITFTATWATGDLLVLPVVRESGDLTPSTPTATGLTFSAMASAGTEGVNDAGLWFYQATAASPGTGVTVTVALAGNTIHWDALLYRFSGATGLGTPVSHVNSTTTTDTNGTLALTTTQANSAIVYAAGDWAAVSQVSPTFSTATAGTFTTEHNVTVSTAYTSFGGVYQNAGAAGAKTVGLTSGSAMRITDYAVEVLGSGGGGAVPVPERLPSNPARFRATNW